MGLGPREMLGARVRVSSRGVSAGLPFARYLRDGRAATDGIVMLRNPDVWDSAPAALDHGIDLGGPK